MLILAHRGWWKTPDEKNTRIAIARAFEAGYGIETDVRDHNGALVIAHDMPVGAAHIPFEEVLDMQARTAGAGVLAINIKADGLHEPVAQALNQAGVQNAFVFDMATPDAMGYLRNGLATFTRHSEIEPSPPYYDRASGVWVDCFFEDWITPEVVLAHRAAGKTVALVSPELHRRPHMSAWASWRELADIEGVMICTDLPDEAVEFFS